MNEAEIQARMIKAAETVREVIDKINPHSFEKYSIQIEVLFAKIVDELNKSTFETPSIDRLALEQENDKLIAKVEKNRALIVTMDGNRK